MKESDKKKIGEAYLRLHSCNENKGMTNEEAIKILKQFRDRQGNSSDDNEAFDMAIKALEQQPCEDCISREAVITKIEYEDRLSFMGVFCDHDAAMGFREEIKELPSVTPQQTRWIPVSERLPESDEQYHTFLVTDRKGKVTLSEFYLSIKDKKPYWSGMIDVIAWMPLPEPYEAESEENADE